MAAQVDAGRLVLVPEGSEALPREGVERTVKAEVRQRLGQPLGVGGKVHLRALQLEGGAVGQVCGVKIALGLCQIDADAADDAPALHLVAVADALAEDAHDLFAVQQQVIGPFYLAVHAVALGQLIADGKACQQRQGGRLGQRLPDDRRIIEGAALGVHPAAAKTAPACGLIGGVYRAHRAELFKMLFRVSVGAAALGQPAHLVDAHALGTSLCSWLTTLPSARVRMP